jgi:hypothetical protein
MVPTSRIFSEDALYAMKNCIKVTFFLFGSLIFGFTRNHG